MAIFKLRRREGCGLLGSLAILFAVGLSIVLWRVGGEPEPWRQEQLRQREQSPEKTEELVQSAERRLRSASREAGRFPPGKPLSPAELSDPAPGPMGTETSPGGKPVPEGSRERRRPTRSSRSADSSRESESQSDEPHRGERRQVVLTLDEVNALLREYSSRWQGQTSGRPLPLSNPLLVFEGDHLVLLTQLSTPAMDVLLGLPFDVFVDPSGGSVRLLGVRLGHMSLPGVEALPRLLRSAGDSRLDRLADKAEEAATGYDFDPRLGLSDSGTVRIVDLELEPEGRLFYLTVEDL